MFAYVHCDFVQDNNESSYFTCYISIHIYNIQIMKFKEIQRHTLSAVVVVVTSISIILHSFQELGSFVTTRNLARNEIDELLYKQVHRGAWKHDRPNCTYESVLQSTHTINAWDAPKQSYVFDPHGIEDGAYSPEHCNPLFSTAIIVTYRNRQKELNIFLPYIHNFLRKQNIHYKIYLVQQADDKPWNKGLLYNLGARRAMMDRFPCLVLHDVDMLPLDAGNLYACTASPRHLSASVDKFRFVLPYYWLVGGVLAVTSHQYNDLNGFSNQFLEWGGEDDELAIRIMQNKLKIMRFPPEMSRYTMLLHRPQRRNGARFRLLRGLGARAGGGLRSPAYGSLRFQRHRLFTRLLVTT